MTVSSGGFTGLQANAKTYSDVTNEYITIGLEAGAIALLGLLAVLARLGWRLRSDRALPVLAAQVRRMVDRVARGEPAPILPHRRLRARRACDAHGCLIGHT